MSDELHDLIEKLADIQRRLGALTGGKVDAIVMSSGGPVLLREAQEHLRRSEADHRRFADERAAILNALPAHVALLDCNGRIAFVNEAWKQFAVANGSSSEGYAIGRNYINICNHAQGADAEQAKEIAEGIQSILNGTSGAYSVEYPCHAPHERRWFELLAAPMPRSSDYGAVVMHINITKRRLAEGSLDDATGLLRVAGQVARLGGWIVHLENERIVWSKETAEIHDEPPTFSPTVEQGIKYYAPEHQKKIEDAFYKCAKDGTSFDETMRFTTAKGRRLWVRSIGEAVRDQAGQIKAVRGALQDISELIEARELLRETIDALPAGIVLYDRDQRLTMFNAMAVAVVPILGQPGAIGMTFEQLVRERASTGALFGSTPEEEIARFRSKGLNHLRQLVDGRWINCSEVATPSGRTVGLRVDVTEIKELERAAKQARDQYRALVDSLSDTVIKVDFHTGIVTFLSGAAADLVGLPVDKLIGISFTDFVLPEDHELVKNVVRASRSAPGTVQEVNFRVSVPAGSPKFVEMRFRTAHEGTAEIVSGVIRDVTERKATEQAAAISDQRFRIVAQLSSNMIWDRDLIEDRLWRNDESTARFGNNASNHRDWTDHIHPDDRDRVVENFNAAVEGANAEWTDEYKFMVPDGSYIQIVSRGAILRDDSGKAFRIIGSAVDVTEQRRLEEKTLQSQKLESIGQLTGGVAHDFNNILMVIMANVDAVLEDEEIATGLKAPVEQIGGAAERAAQLTRQLMAFSRKQVLRPQRTNLNDQVVATGALLRRTLGDHIEVDSILADDLWTIDTDRAQVEAALINLCINARDAMPEGGRLLIETRNTVLDKDYVTANPDATVGDYVMLSVTDSGSGMPPEVVARVFEPFFTTKGVGKGTGLGLSMVYGFVKQSRGHITIYSEVGHGTAIKLYFRRCEQEAEKEVAKPAATMPGGTERIFVVEDEKQVRAIVVNQLNSLGYTVEQATNGSEGLAVLRSGQSFDLLLTDVVMPGPINGRALAEAAIKLHPGLRVLFMSGYSEDAISTLGILHSGVTLLNKPFRKVDLAMAVRRAIDSTQASSSSNK